MPRKQQDMPPLEATRMDFGDDWVPPHKAAKAARRRLANEWQDFRTTLLAALDAWQDDPFGHPRTRQTTRVTLVELLDGIVESLTTDLADDRLLFSRIQNAHQAWLRPRATLVYAVFHHLQLIRIERAQLRSSSLKAMHRRRLDDLLDGKGAPDLLRRKLQREDWERMSAGWRGERRGVDIDPAHPVDGKVKKYSPYEVVFETMKARELTNAGSHQKLRATARSSAYGPRSQR